MGTARYRELDQRTEVRPGVHDAEARWVSQHMLGDLVNAVTTSADDEPETPASPSDSTPTRDHDTPPVASSQSPEATVQALLDERGGRMFQQDVVDNTDYSAATVSRLLTEMEADGQITRYRKDRRKVVAYPGLGPESVKHGQ